MSAEAVGYVYRFSPFTGATFAVHHAVADSVSDQHDNEFWMVSGKLARKARIARRQTVLTALATLTEAGYLELLEQGGGRSAPSRYRFLFPRGEVVYDSRKRSGDRTDSVATAGGGKGAVAARKGAVSARNGAVTAQAKNPSNPTEPKGNGAQGAEGRLIDPPRGADLGHNGGGFEAREIVTEHWDWCRANLRPTPTLRGGRGSRGSPFIALSSVVRTLLDAGHDRAAIVGALQRTAAYTIDALTLELNRNRPDRHAAPRSGADYVAVAQRRAACPDCGGSGWLEVDGTAVACEHPAAS